jgi:hypothetical protein
LTNILNSKFATKSMLLISVTLLGSLVVAASVHSARATGTLGLTKGYGPNIGSAQPYEPGGPWIDGILVSQFLINQNNEWSALKAGTIDLYDWSLRHSQRLELNSPCTGPPPACLCVTAPDAPAGIAPCPAGQAPIAHEITAPAVNNFGKFEIDLQNAAFPTNLLAFRQAVAFATDKEQFIRDTLGGDGAPNYAVVGCPALCGPGADGIFGTADDLWVKPSLNEAGVSCLSVVGTAMPFTAGGHCGAPAGTLDAARIAAANALLDSLGFASRDSLGFRLDNGPGCASRLITDGTATPVARNNCGLELQPVFYVRHDDPNRENLGFQVQKVLQNSLGIDMNLIAATGQYPTQFRHFIDVNRRALFNSVFGLFAFNMYTGGWGLSADPTYIDDLYDSQFIRPFLTNYPNYNDALFNGFARGLRAAQQGPPSDFFANARSLAFAAEQEFNDTVAIVDVWTDTGGLAYRIYHTDADSVLNGLKWEGLQIQTGVGPYGQWSWFNAHLVGAPLHDPAHPVFMKWGWKTDLLDSPNPIDSSFLWDGFANGLEYDTLNVKVADDAGFTGDLPQMASLPSVKVITPVGGVCTFPNGETSGFDVPGNVCSVLSYQLRPDLSFAASLDGKIPAVPVTPNDIRFSIFDSKNSPTSFLTPGYVHVQDVVVTGAFSFDVYERNAAVWARHDIGGTTVISVQHWCQEAHDTWTGGTLANCTANPGTTGFVGNTATGWPDFGVNTLSSTSGHQLPGAPVAVDLGSYAFTYDSAVSFPGNSPNGPILYRLRQTPGLTLPAGTATCQPTGTGCGYSAPAPDDSYFTSLDITYNYRTGTVPDSATQTVGSGAKVIGTYTTSTNPGPPATVTATVGTWSISAGGVTVNCPTPQSATVNKPTPPQTATITFKCTAVINGHAYTSVLTFTFLDAYTATLSIFSGAYWKYHLAGNINWYCTATTAQPCSSGIVSEMGPLPAPDSVINIVDLAIVAVHFGETPGVTGPYGSAPWDINGPSGSPDGKVDIFDLGRVAVHFGQSFWGGTDIGGGAVGTLPGWAFE